MNLKSILVVLSFVLFLNQNFAQCISSGAKQSTVFTNSIGIGSIAWLNPANTAASDNVRSTAGAAIGILSTSSANWNMTGGFGFSLPAYAIICGIQVDMEKRQQGVLIGSSVTDNSVKIMKNGVITGSEHASGAGWPSTDTYVSYGGPGDTWGTTWTAADINASNFGFAYSANLNAGLASLFLSAEVDYVQMTVFYDLVLPIKFSEFSATCIANGVSLNWTTTGQSDKDYFTIERTINGIDFEAVGTVKSSATINETTNYSFTDYYSQKGTYYYRIKQTSANGIYNYSSLVSVECPFEPSEIFYPNPSSGKLSFDATGDLSIYNLQGKEVYSQQNISGRTDIDLSDQQAGIYFYQLRSEKKVVSSGRLVLLPTR